MHELRGYTSKCSDIAKSNLSRYSVATYTEQAVISQIRVPLEVRVRVNAP